MPQALDLEPNEELVRKRISLSELTYELAKEDMHKCGISSLSMYLRMLIRKRHDIKERFGGQLPDTGL